MHASSPFIEDDCVRKRKTVHGLSSQPHVFVGVFCRQEAAHGAAAVVVLTGACSSRCLLWDSMTDNTVSFLFRPFSVCSPGLYFFPPENLIRFRLCPPFFIFGQEALWGLTHIGWLFSGSKFPFAAFRSSMISVLPKSNVPSFRYVHW